jgi:hypothetical protein
MISLPKSTWLDNLLVGFIGVITPRWVLLPFQDRVLNYTTQYTRADIEADKEFTMSPSTQKW